MGSQWTNISPAVDCTPDGQCSEEGAWEELLVIVDTYVHCMYRYVHTYVHGQHPALHVNCVVVYTFVHGIVYCTHNVSLLHVHTVNHPHMLLVELKAQQKQYHQNLTHHSVQSGSRITTT